MLLWCMNRFSIITLLLLCLAPAAWAENWVSLGVYEFFMLVDVVECEVSLDRDSVVRSADTLQFRLRATLIGNSYYEMTSDCRSRRVVMIKWYDSKKVKWIGMSSEDIDVDRRESWEPILNKVCDSYGR